MYIHFKDISIGAQFLRTFVTPVYTKIAEVSYAALQDANLDDHIVAASGGDIILLRESQMIEQPYCGVIELD